MKTKEELNAIREAQKRLSWIENVKRIKNWTQEQAEKEWDKIFNQNIDFNHETFHSSKEIVALKAALAELIPIAERHVYMHGNDYSVVDRKAAIDRARKLLDKQPQSESDGDKNLS